MAPSDNTAAARPVRAVVRPRPALRRLLFVTWTVFWMAAGLIALEVASRWWLNPWHQEVGNRHMQPYFMTGGYYQTPLPGVRAENVLLGPGGPETYGYRRDGSAYVFGFEQPVGSVSERGTFLFQDRIEIANARPAPGVRRVFVLGGSAAYGVGASNRDARWYAVLERELNAALSEDVHVVPAAMVGYVSTQERIALELMILPRAPDAIVVLDGWNDAALPAVFGVRPGDPYDQGLLYGEFYSALGGLWKWLAKRSHAARYVLQRRIAKAVERQRQQILADPARITAYGASTSSVYLDNLTHMLGRCRDEGVPCAAFLQPSRDVASPMDVSDRNPLVLASYARIRDRLHESTGGERVHDLSELLASDDRLFVDKVHFTDAGHEAVARAILPHVIGMLADAAGRR